MSCKNTKNLKKYLFLDMGLMLRLLNMTIGNGKELTQQILTSNVTDLVNKGSVAELIVGLELLRYQAKNSQAEIDYVINYNQSVLPIEVKSRNTRWNEEFMAFYERKEIRKSNSLFIRKLWQF